MNRTQKYHLTTVDNVIFCPKRQILLILTALLKAYQVVDKYKGENGETTAAAAMTSYCFHSLKATFSFF